MSLIAEAGVAYCRRAARASGSNFYYALWLLPPARREAMFAVYSFCRAVDDVVDNGPRERAEQELTCWRQELAACYEGWPAHPIAQALKAVVAQHQIPRQLLDDIITGMTWDLTTRRYPTFAELEQYCYHVAGAVGLVAIRVFGCRQPESERFARTLGTAFQLTNILRDVAADAARGRLYLPQEDLTRFKVREEDLQGRFSQNTLSGEGLWRTVPEPVRALLAFEAARARDYFAQAKRAVTRQDRRALTPALAMAAVYERLLDRLEAARFDVFSAPIRLPTPQKLLLALRGALS